MDAPTSEGDRIPFSEPDAVFGNFTQDDVIELAYCAGDFMLAIDEYSIIRDISVRGDDQSIASRWIGQKWVETVTTESRPKIERMLDTRQGRDRTWRQVNHRHDGEEVPVRYRLIRPHKGRWALAIGQDMRGMASMQQRLLKTQQSMERDYLALRQTETRYRLLFDTISHPVIIADAARLEIQQANRAMHALVGAGAGGLDGKPLTALVDGKDRDRLLTHIGAATARGTAVEPLELQLVAHKEPVRLSLSTFRQAGRQLWLVNVDPGRQSLPLRQTDRLVLHALEQMPDAFVLADAKHKIVVANKSFAELVQAGSVEQLVGQPLERFIGRPDVDLALIRKQLRDHGTLRNFSSVVVDLTGFEEPVEISALAIEDDGPLYGFAIRLVARRERDLPASEEEMPRSVEQLTELVGRKPLKEIVRESTDLIERMCIEAALIHTSDNRASAAEILGLSRQSLYSKMHRHGLGDLDPRD
ncbi:transcriptional regulator PpsR [Parerythrobacter aurantius]|uniref:transcriptional regulator PpsR n=1 Tax=Parerythrobacter aurantius TaxID=3127706 RepID=UPI003254D1E2